MGLSCTDASGAPDLLGAKDVCRPTFSLSEEDVAEVSDFDDDCGVGRTSVVCGFHTGGDVGVDNG